MLEQSRIVAGMEICDRDGHKLGKVAHVYRHDPALVSKPGGSSRLAQHVLVEVKTGFLGLGKRLYVPNAFIQEVTGGRVFLTKPADEVMRKDELRFKPSYLDGL